MILKNTYLNTLIEEFDLRLKCDDFEIKMVEILTQKHELLKNCIQMGSMSLVEENKERDVNNNNNNKNNNNNSNSNSNKSNSNDNSNSNSSNKSISNNSDNNNSSNDGNKNMKDDCSNEENDKKEYLDIQDVGAISVLKSNRAVMINRAKNLDNET